MRRRRAGGTTIARRSLPGVLVCGACMTVPVAEAQERATQAPAVEVVAPTPIPGLGVPKDKVPANVQTGDAEDLRNPGTMTLPDLMERSFDSVNINQSQGNPYQPDINFRGFTGSPLLGTSPGLSMFQDGVRINEPFGDGVNWDLHPEPRDRHHHPHARLQPRVRAQHARWRNLDHDQERVRLPGSRRPGLRRVVPAGGRRHRIWGFRRPGRLLRDRQRILRARLAGQHEHAHLAGVRQAELPRSGHQSGFQLHGCEQHAERRAGDTDLLPRAEAARRATRFPTPSRTSSQRSRSTASIRSPIGACCRAPSTTAGSRARTSAPTSTTISIPRNRSRPATRKGRTSRSI